MARSSPHTRMTVRSIAAIALLVPIAALARGGTYRSEDRYDPQHISALPPDVRQAVVDKCPEPRALHDFSRYRDGTTQIVLHYEHLLCGTSTSYCTASTCLHQVYGATGNGHFRLMRSFYVTRPDPDHF